MWENKYELRKQRGYEEKTIKKWIYKSWKNIKRTINCEEKLVVTISNEYL